MDSFQTTVAIQQSKCEMKIGIAVLVRYRALYAQAQTKGLFTAHVKR